MKRVFIDIPAFSDSLYQTEINLSNQDSHHLAHVLRLRSGTSLIAVCKKTGEEYSALVTEVSNNVKIKLLSPLTNLNIMTCVTSLCFALTKANKTDLVCEKASELGVPHIIFWQAERSVVRLSSKNIEQKISRWTRIAESAAKQSHKNFIPKVHLALTPKDLLANITSLHSPKDRCLYCSLSPKAAHIRELSPTPSPDSRFHLVIGPEGDISPSEEEGFIKSGFELMSLGPYILRSETAAIVAIAMIHAIYGK